MSFFNLSFSPFNISCLSCQFLTQSSSHAKLHSLYQVFILRLRLLMPLIPHRNTQRMNHLLRQPTWLLLNLFPNPPRLLILKVGYPSLKLHNSTLVWIQPLIRLTFSWEPCMFLDSEREVRHSSRGSVGQEPCFNRESEEPIFNQE